MPGVKKTMYKKKSTFSRRPYAQRRAVRSGGHAFTPPADMPTINQNAFKKFRVEVRKPVTTVGAVGLVKISDIVNNIVSTNGISTTTLGLRIKRIMFIDMKPVGLIPSINNNTASTGKYQYIANVRDAGDFDKPARVGWNYSATEQNYTFGANTFDDQNFVLFSHQENTNEITYYVDVEYMTGLGEAPLVDE